jgi:hypothetical protein
MAASETKVAAPAAGTGGEPANAKTVLLTLVIVAAVANLPLAKANVALPIIARDEVL